MITYEKCNICKETYEVRECDHRKKQYHRRSTPIRCPYCGNCTYWISYGWFETRKLK